MDTEAIFVDSTHIKASANLKKQARKAVPEEAKRYAHELFDEIDKDREAHGKKPFDENNNGNDSGSGDNSGESEMVEKTVSTTDPECGVFHKGEHKKVFAYEAHTACDKHNFILGVHVTPGNIHDSVAFDSLYDDICQHYPEHKIVAADSAYKTPWICKRIFESGRVLTSFYHKPRWLPRIQKPLLSVCRLPNKSDVYTKCQVRKNVTRHIWQRFVDMAEGVRHTPLCRDTYKLRQQKIERVFADAKEKHGMRYTQYRGLAQVTNWVKLKFAAMNLKKLATWKWKRKNPSPGKRRRRIFPADYFSWLLFSLFKRKSLPWRDC